MGEGPHVGWGADRSLETVNDSMTRRLSGDASLLPHSLRALLRLPELVEIMGKWSEAVKKFAGSGDPAYNPEVMPLDSL